MLAVLGEAAQKLKAYLPTEEPEPNLPDEVVDAAIARLGALSPRESETLKVIVGGTNSNKEIGIALGGISAGTVKQHLKHAAVKLGFAGTSTLRIFLRAAAAREAVLRPAA